MNIYHAGQADPRNAAAAITAIREDAKLLRLAEFVEEARKEKNDKLVIIVNKDGMFSRKVKTDEELAELRKEVSPRDEIEGRRRQNSRNYLLREITRTVRKGRLLPGNHYPC